MIPYAKFCMLIFLNNIAPSLDPTENPKCKECNSMDLDSVFLSVFHINLCLTCKDNFPDKYSLITKTEAKEDYLLTDRKYNYAVVLL